MTEPSPPVRMRMAAACGQRLIARPRTVTAARASSPLSPTLRFVPSISIWITAFVPWFGAFVFAEAPVWEYPLIVSASVMIGRTDASEIVWTPLPVMLKSIVSAPGLALASVIACRSEPAPLSLMLVTVYVVAARCAAARQRSEPGGEESLHANAAFRLLQVEPSSEGRPAAVGNAGRSPAFTRILPASHLCSLEG